jgi:dihydroneopterin aldolase
MTDRIALRGLTIRGFHGVLAQERRDGQDFGVDAVLEVDITDAAATDDLARTVDYSEVAQRLATIVAGEPLDLIETLAERLAAACLEQPLVSAVEITVHKPHAPVALPFEDVTVTIRRTRER